MKRNEKGMWKQMGKKSKFRSKEKNNPKGKNPTKNVIKAREKKIRREKISRNLSSMAWEIEEIQDEHQEYLTKDHRNQLLLLRERMRKLSNQLR